MKDYINSIAATAATGHATEHSYRAHVETLFHQLFPQFSTTSAYQPPCKAPSA